MSRIRFASVALAPGVGSAPFSAALLPSAAQADCLQWDISGNLKITQSNGFLVSMDLQQTGTTISGTGSKEPGGAALQDANGDDIGITPGTKWLVRKKQTDPVWYMLQTNPVGWVWGKDVTVGP